MAVVCECNSLSLGNTGQEKCPIEAVNKKDIYVPYFDADGNINEIDVASTTFNQPFLDALTRQSDKSKRWHPTGEIKNIEDVRGDSIFESANDGSNFKIQTGTRTFVGFDFKSSPNFADKLNANSCVPVGVFKVDKDGNLIGNGGSNPGSLRPIRIQDGTWDSGYMKPTDTTIAKTRIKYEYGQLERDEDLRMVSAADITADLLNSQGLLDADADGAASTISTTGFTQTIKTCYGSLKSPILVKGLVIADFVSSVGGATSNLRNTFDNADVPILTLTESPEGTYAFTFAAQTSADTIAIDVAEASGFDGTLLSADVVTIP